MVQADVDAILDAGWDEEAFYHVVSICGLFNYINRIAEGYGFKSTLVYRDHKGEHLAKNGYLDN